MEILPKVNIHQVNIFFTNTDSRIFFISFDSSRISYFNKNSCVLANLSMS